MKRIRKRKTQPKELADYIRQNPESAETHTWDSFRDSCPSGLKAVRQALSEDQGGLCAYCELELIPKFDFRVSHFHPKRAKGEEKCHKWELCWENMLGACNGGTALYYLKPERFVASKSDVDQHCDVVLGNEVLDDVILNPLLIPAFPRLFKYEERTLGAGQTGLAIEIEKDACADVVYRDVKDCVGRAQETIERLHLNSGNLMAMRQATYEEIKNQIARSVASGISLPEAMKQLSEKVFSKKGQWPEFFTVWRWALRDKAEQTLQSLGFNG